jgi:hypothetical protein
MSYNGWANYETWNVALWIGNDESLYRMAKQCAKFPTPYRRLCHKLIANGYDRTPDGVRWNSPKVRYRELNRMLAEL